MVKKPDQEFRETRPYSQEAIKKERGLRETAQFTAAETRSKVIQLFQLSAGQEFSVPISGQHVIQYGPHKIEIKYDPESNKPFKIRIFGKVYEFAGEGGAFTLMQKGETSEGIDLEIRAKEDEIIFLNRNRTDLKYIMEYDE